MTNKTERNLKIAGLIGIGAFGFWALSKLGVIAWFFGFIA